MLSQATPVPTIPTKDMATARHFYESVLGFAPGVEQMDGVEYRSGAGTFFLYNSSFAGSNQATAMSFDLSPEDFDADVARIAAAGVTFQTFDLPSDVGSWQDGVAVMGEVKSVWFADPDGNILNIGCQRPSDG